MDTDAIADLCLAAELFLRDLVVVEMEFVGEKARAEEIFIRSDDDFSRVRTQLDDVKRRPGSDAQALSLADRIIRDALVLAEHMALFVDDISWLERFRRVVPEEFHVRFFAGQEADILRLCLVVSRKALFLGNKARILLERAAKRENNMRKLFLGQVVHHVGLILGDVQTLSDLKQFRFRIVDDARVVAGRKVRRVECLSHFIIEETELHLEIAHHAGIRRHPCCVGLDEIIEDELLVRLSHIDDLERNPDEFRHLAGAFDLLVLPVKLIHGSAVNLIALIEQEARGQRGIHAAGHCHDDFLLFCHNKILSENHHPRKHFRRNLIGVKVRRMRSRHFFRCAEETARGGAPLERETEIPHYYTMGNQEFLPFYIEKWK